MHIQWLDGVLSSLERAGCTVSGAKSQWLMNGIKIVGYICSSTGRLLETSKVIKIIEWPLCNSVTKACTFIGICIYYQIWIKRFSMIAAPIYMLFKKNTIFLWMYGCQEAMDLLKNALTSVPALV